MRRWVQPVSARARRSGQHYLLPRHRARWLACALLGALALACGEPAPEPPAAAPPAQPLATAKGPAELPVVLFLGPSLPAGYGLPSEEAFPALVQRRIDAAALPFRVVNAGVSGDTSAGGRRRIDWLLRLPVAVLVIELGANDMLRGLGIEALRSNLRHILDRTRDAYPGVRFVIAGMRAAPNLGAAYAREFDATFPVLAEGYDSALIPFLLDGVAAVRRLNQPDGIHPTAEGHQRVADTVWQTLEPVLRSH